MGDFDLIDASERSLIDLLLRREAISHQHITEALEYQCRLPHSAYLTLDQILVDMEYLTPQALAAAQRELGIVESDGGAARRSQLPGTEARPLNLASLFEPTPAQTQSSGVLELAPENLGPDLAALFDAAPAPADELAAFNAAPAPPPDLAALFGGDALPPDDLAALFAASPPPPDLAGLFDDSVPPPDLSAFYDSALPPAATAPPPAMVPPPAALVPPPVAPPAVPEAPPPAPALPQGVRAAGAFAQRSVQAPGGSWGVAPPVPSRPMPAMPGQTSATLPVQPLPDPGLPRPQLGEILIKNHELEEWQLTHALCIQRAAPQTTPKLGTLLVRLGYVEPQAVERALGSQTDKKS